jgi:hypothetical protein
MRALAETRIAFRAGAGAECTRIELTNKTDPRLCIAKAEISTGLLGRVRWSGGNHWLRRRSGINRPRERRSIARVPSSILGLDREGMSTLAQSGIGFRTSAGKERTIIQLA